MKSELVSPGLACLLLLQWMSFLPRRCQGCPSWSRRAWPSGRMCSIAGCQGFEAPLEGSARCRPPAQARCGELPSARRCRRLPSEACQSEETLRSNMFWRSANCISRCTKYNMFIRPSQLNTLVFLVKIFEFHFYKRKFWAEFNGTGCLRNY